MKRYFGTWKFYKMTLLIALPIMAQQFITSFVNLIDNIMIGSVGNIALTSVTVSNRYYLIFNATLFGICGAASIFIAQYYGAKEKEKCQKVFNISMSWSILMALLFMIVLFIMPQLVINIFSKTPSIVTQSLMYLNYIKYAYLPCAISFACMMTLRAVGVNTIQLKVGAIAVLINTLLNYCLIFGNFGFPEMGIEGAAIATLIARIVEMTIYLYVIYRNKHYFKLDIKGLIYLDKDLMRNLIKKIVPLTFNEVMFSMGLALVFMSYMRTDEHLVAAVAVVDTVANILFIVFAGLSSAVSILIGKKLGANLIDEAKENARKLIVFAGLIAAFLGMIVFIVAPYIPEFYNVQPDIKEAITILLRVKSVSIILHAVNACVFLILRSGGDIVSTLIMDSGFLWCGAVLVSTVLSMRTSLSLIFIYAIVESLEIIRVFVSTHFFKKEKWAKNITVSQD